MVGIYAVENSAKWATKQDRARRELEPVIYLGVQQCFGVVYHEITTLRQGSFSCLSKINLS